MQIKTKNGIFGKSKKSKDALEKYFKKQFKQKTNMTIQDLIDKLFAIEDKSKEVFLIIEDSEAVAKRVVEEINTISIIG